MALPKVKKIGKNCKKLMQNTLINQNHLNNSSTLTLTIEIFDSQKRIDKCKLYYVGGIVGG